MKIQLVSFTTTYEPGKGNKQGWSRGVVKYINNGEAREHKLVSFKNPSVWKVLKEAKEGDTLEVEYSKNEGGFNEWTKAEVVEHEMPSVSGGGTAVKGYTAPTTRVVQQRDYETKEERAARQALIVRQNALGNAVAALTPGAKAPLKYAEVISLAEEFVDWIMDTDTVDLAKPDVSDMQDDIPF